MEKAVSFLSYHFLFQVRFSIRAAVTLRTTKERKKTQAKQIKAIREITPGTKRPEVNRGEALSK